MNAPMMLEFSRSLRGELGNLLNIGQEFILGFHRGVPRRREPDIHTSRRSDVLHQNPRDCRRWLIYEFLPDRLGNELGPLHQEMKRPCELSQGREGETGIQLTLVLRL